MTNEARMPPDENAETPETPAAATTQVPEPMPVLSVNDAGAVSARKRGKSGPAAKKGATAAQRKPEKKKPTGKTAKKAASKAGGARFKSTTAAKGSWKSTAKRTAGSKPTAAQKKTPIKKSSAKKSSAKKSSAKKSSAKKAAPAAKRGQAKRATRR